MGRRDRGAEGAAGLTYRGWRLHVAEENGRLVGYAYAPVEHEDEGWGYGVLQGDEAEIVARLRELVDEHEGVVATPQPR